MEVSGDELVSDVKEVIFFVLCFASHTGRYCFLFPRCGRVCCSDLSDTMGLL